MKPNEQILKRFDHLESKIPELHKLDGSEDTVRCEEAVAGQKGAAYRLARVRQTNTHLEIGFILAGTMQWKWGAHASGVWCLASRQTLPTVFLLTLNNHGKSLLVEVVVETTTTARGTRGFGNVRCTKFFQNAFRSNRSSTRRPFGDSDSKRFLNFSKHGIVEFSARRRPCIFCITASQYQRMRTTVTLDDDIFKAAQAQAEASGKKLGQVLSQLARRGLRASAQSATRTGLPVFKVDPNAGIIPSSRAKELLAEDQT